MGSRGRPLSFLPSLPEHEARLLSPCLVAAPSPRLVDHHPPEQMAPDRNENHSRRRAWSLSVVVPPVRAIAISNALRYGRRYTITCIYLYTSLELAALNSKWKMDAIVIGKATCPVCSALLGCGPGGVKMLVKQHENTPTCFETKLKRDKAGTQRKNGNLTTFFPKKPPVAHVPSIVKAPNLIIKEKARPANPAKITVKTTVAPVVTAAVPASQLLDQLRGNVSLLPATVPVADATNPLSAFSRDPAGYLPAGVKPTELWEALAPLFHGAFGYGTTKEARMGMVQCGAQALDGVLCFLEYFLIESVQSVLKLNNITSMEIGDVLMDMRAQSVPTVHNVVEIDDIPMAEETRDIIDVDATPVSLTAPTNSSHPASPCMGFRLPHTITSSDYPHQLHEELPERRWPKKLEAHLYPFPYVVESDFHPILAPEKQLSDSNWLSWDDVIISILRGRGLEGYPTGVVLQQQNGTFPGHPLLPNSDVPSAEEWSLRDGIASSIIYQNIVDPMAHGLIPTETSREMYLKLHAKFH
ncbi:hypothetical protein GGX14DRAFT_603424 [Mycena pura]|uniref:Uncharacterized protein n=1 Tax=Mycena pura TaxID=153505 RepID=A0AAD6UMW5_9AGAR|nr:hypothetical protein GGX14DRAFT_603424 [Mycena pura]